MAKEEKEFSFGDLNRAMSKVSQYGDTMDNSDISTIDEYLNTGNYMLNAALVGDIFKGYPNNRSTALVGPSGTGKTYLIMNACKQAQDQGYYIVYYDSENAVDKTLLNKFKIDLTKFRYEPVNTVQEFRSNITAMLDMLIENKEKGFKIPKIMVCLDSAGNLATQKEIEDAKSKEDKADMTRAKLLKSTFRILMTKMALCHVNFIFSNHSYSSQSFIPTQVAGGGCLSPESLVLMSNGEFKEIKDISEGDFVETLDGKKKILKTWKLNKPSYRIKFEDGSELVCSEDHRFYTGNENDDYLDDNNWIYAKNLVENDEISQVVVK